MLIKFKESKIEEIGFSMTDLIEENETNPTEELKDNLFYQKNLEILNAIEPLIIANPWKEHYPEIEFRENVEVEVIFAPESLKEDIQNSFDIGKDLLGLAAFTHGEMLLGEQMYNDKFQVIVFCPSNKDLKVSLESVPEELRIDYLYSLLNTLTHELSHITLFLESSGGQTPHEVDMNFEAGIFDNDVTDCILGINHQKYEELFFDCDDTNEIMETIVENKGFGLLNKIRFSNNKVLNLKNFEKNIIDFKISKRNFKI